MEAKPQAGISMHDGSPSMPLPFVDEDGEAVTLYFRIGSVQSQMRANAPDHLVLSYTRTLMSFLSFNPSPRRVGMIGLGGGSMAKWCYRHLPNSQIMVAEINPHVVAMRERFSIPADDARFRVLVENGADFVARARNEFDVLLVDGFDHQGQPPELCSQAFYDDCYEALTASGILGVNLCEWEAGQINFHRIRQSFGKRALVVRPEEDENKLVFAYKDEAMWQRTSPASFRFKVKEFEKRQDAHRKPDVTAPVANKSQRASMMD
jgi:spermidine synthase